MTTRDDGNAPPLVLGIDPGPTTSGAVLYSPNSKRVLSICKAGSHEQVCDLIDGLHFATPPHRVVVAIEQVQSYGIAGASLLRTAEVGGRFYQRALDAGRAPVWLPRREVLQVLDITGRGNRDALVRQRLIEMHGGSREVAVGRKASPGPLYGISGHAWQALGVGVAAHLSGRTALTHPDGGS